MNTNTMKAKLKAGQPVFGVQVDADWPELVEVLGHVGFDWVFLDAEHGPLSEATIVQMVRAAETAGITPVVRVPRNEPETILRYLETGVAGIVVPQVNSGEEARRIVQAVKYPPVGARGIGASRASGYGFKFGGGEEFRRRANAETIIIALLENVRGVENLDDILAVDGIDVVFVGPADLSASMGGEIGFEVPAVRKLVDEVLRQDHRLRAHRWREHGSVRSASQSVRRRWGAVPDHRCLGLDRRRGECVLELGLRA